MTILKVPNELYTAEEIERSEQLADDLTAAQAEHPKVMEEYSKLGKATLAAKRALDDAITAQALPREITALELAYRNAQWAQRRPLSNHKLKVGCIQRELEKLTYPLRLEVHRRWLAELQNLPKFRVLDIVKEHYSELTEKRSVDVRTNDPALQEVKERLLTAIRQLGELQHSDIPTIEEFVRGFEDELAKIDLTVSRRVNDLPKRVVEESKESKPDDGPLPTAIKAGSEMLILGEPQIDRDRRKLAKLKQELDALKAS